MPFEVKTNTFDESIYQKLKEAELEMGRISKRYSKEDVLESMDIIIG